MAQPRKPVAPIKRIFMSGLTRRQRLQRGPRQHPSIDPELRTVAWTIPTAFEWIEMDHAAGMGASRRNQVQAVVGVTISGDFFAVETQQRALPRRDIGRAGDLAAGEMFGHV